MVCDKNHLKLIQGQLRFAMLAFQTLLEFLSVKVSYSLTAIFMYLWEQVHQNKLNECNNKKINDMEGRTKQT